jgi:hypothetical protein
MSQAHGWIRDLVDSLDANLDESTRAAVLAECGRRCLPQSVVARAHALWLAQGDLDAWVAAMNAEHLGGGYLERRGSEIHGRYERCYCPLAREAGEGLSPTFCNCSRAWLEGLFVGALGRSAQVEMTQTVVGGAPDCRWTVRLG